MMICAPVSAKCSSVRCCSVMVASGMSTRATTTRVRPSSSASARTVGSVCTPVLAGKVFAHGEPRSVAGLMCRL
jgi:hypothetical protein